MDSTTSQTESKAALPDNNEIIFCAAVRYIYKAGPFGLPYIYIIITLPLMLNSVDTSDLLFPDCPVRNVLSRVGDKWSLLVMHTLMEHPAPMRFSAIRRAVPDISQKVLTTTLRHLEEDQFVERMVYAEVPPRVEYKLLENGKSFMAACQPMIAWAAEHLAEIVKHRKEGENHFNSKKYIAVR